MADRTQVAQRAAPTLSPDDLERVEQFTREPFTPDLDAMEPGTARRRAFDAALAEIEEGREHPSVEWRRDYALMLGVPAQRKAWMSRHGHRLEKRDAENNLVCPESGWRYAEAEPGKLRCLDWPEDKALEPAT